MTKFEILEIVELDHNGKCAIYSSHRRGPFDTPLIFKGTEDECEKFIIGDRKVIKAF